MVTGRIRLLVTQPAVFVTVELTPTSFLFSAFWAGLLGREQTPRVLVDHMAGSKNVRVVGERRMDEPAVRQVLLGGRIQQT